MNSSTQTLREGQESAKTVMVGSIPEGIASGGAFVLALIGLSGIAPSGMLTVAVLVMGAAFLFEGAAVSLRFSNLLAETSKDRLDRAEFGLGITAEFLGGITGIVLGILSVFQIASMILIPSAVIVYGITLLLSSGVTHRLNALEIEGVEESTRFKKIASEATSATAWLEFVLGIAAVILGISALVGFHAAFSLVGMLVVGAAGLVTGAAVTSRMISLFRK